MSLKLLNLNIFQGKFLPKIIDYIKTQDFDILHLQEVSGGAFSKGGVWSGARQSQTVANPETVGIDCFATIKQELGYQGVLNTTIAKRNDHASYFANATFFKPELKLIETKELFLKPYEEIGDTPLSPADAPRAALITTFQIGAKDMCFINCHLAWGPNSNDEPYKLSQARILYEYLQSLKTPFVLSGDFNVDARSKIVMWFSTLAKNLNTQYGITNTLNPRIHAAKKLFPVGLGIDFVFVTKDVEVTDFHLVDTPDLSDHLGLSLTMKL